MTENYLNYSTVGPEASPWVSFIPGIGNDAEFWRAQADALSGEYRTLRFEPWGCNGSGLPSAPPDGATIDDAAAAVIGLWDSLGIERSVVVGLGFGGSTALYTALRYPDRVDGVAAFCCRTRLPEDRRDFWLDRRSAARRHGLSRLADLTVDRWLRPEFRASHPEVDQLLHTGFRRGSVAGYCAYVSAFITMDFTDELAALSVPALFVAAEHDHGGGPPAAMRVMAESVPGSRFELVPTSGHMVAHEAPAAVTRLIGEFLTSDVRRFRSRLPAN